MNDFHSTIKRICDDLTQIDVDAMVKAIEIKIKNGSFQKWFEKHKKDSEQSDKELHNAFKVHWTKLHEPMDI